MENLQLRRGCEYGTEWRGKKPTLPSKYLKTKGILKSKSCSAIVHRKPQEIINKEQTTKFHRHYIQEKWWAQSVHTETNSST